MIRSYLTELTLLRKTKFLLLVRTLFPMTKQVKIARGIASVLLVWIFFPSDTMDKYCMWDIQQKFRCRGGWRREEHNRNGGGQRGTSKIQS